MSTFLKVFSALDWIALSVRFFKNHLLTVLGLGFLAAVGRATQLGAFGPVSHAFDLLLEIGVESSRILLFLYALGLTDVQTGAASVLRLFSAGANRRRNWRVAVQKVKSHWRAMLLNLAAFLLIAWSINSLIDYAAYQTCLYTKLKASQLIADEASEWAFILFLKNISIIPFTLVFNALFLRWVTNRLTGSFTAGPGTH
jgi:hypothetical protein